MLALSCTKEQTEGKHPGTHKTTQMSQNLTQRKKASQRDGT